MIILGGGGPMDATKRRPWIDWVHTALVQGNLVRDFVKWDDQPYTLTSIPDSILRAYRVATMEPQGPVMVTSYIPLRPCGLRPITAFLCLL